MRYPIHNRWSGAVQFVAEMECAEGERAGIKIGLAVKWALKNDAVLRGAVLSDAVLRGADLSGAVLSDAVLSGAVLSGAVLSGADLSGAVLRGAVLRGAVLRGAVLSGAVLRGAVLSDAVLRGADLSGAVLSDADLSGADLSGADLSGAVLSDAVLSGADGEKHHVDGRCGIIQAGDPNGWLAFGYVDTESQAIRVHIGCRRKSLVEGRAYWSKTHPAFNRRREVLAALDYIEAIAKLRGWRAP